MNIIIKATLFTLAIGFGGTAVASPNGGLVDRINDTRSYPNKTVETGTQNGQEQQRMMEKMQELHSKDGSDGEIAQKHCMKLKQEHKDRSVSS
ncbi:hypothetical protein [Hydrocarboniclastica marina]|uniref:Uncharacterized protein n=1 Tax=Hydrocarboniclastica marina TaxID=2259620 RepID=A0A4P7XJH5_9ALTE|nr:hypothetical protein [Hydrocarboniclastica marina]QCF26512.1 hypothetical protein soil367_11495 [Hydrocarboniclastica marina]|tara:strand:+ start:4056 stop:4334 length:279 start_codon:yes stop_codon:yes gene_type:complete